MSRHVNVLNFVKVLGIMSKRNTQSNQKNTLKNYFDKSGGHQSSETGKTTDLLDFNNFYRECLSEAVEENAAIDETDLGDVNLSVREQIHLLPGSFAVCNQEVCIIAKIMISVVSIKLQ